MSEEDFLARWSRRKRANAKEPPAPPPAEPAPPAEPLPAAAPAPVAAKAEDEFDPSTLPPIESITGATDITDFLRKGVPLELSRAALRRAWTSDPAIRDFRGLQENDWDFNAPDSIPGFGTFKSDVEIRELAARVFGTHNEASEPIPQVAPADRPTEPAGEEAAAALDKVQVAEAMPGAAMSDDASAAAAQQSDDSPEPVVTARKHGGALPH